MSRMSILAIVALIHLLSCGCKNPDDGPKPHVFSAYPKQTLPQLAKPTVPKMPPPAELKVPAPLTIPKENTRRSAK